MRVFYCIWTLALALAAAPASAQGQPDARTRGYTVFVAGAPVGVENVLVEVNAGELIITSHGRLDPPANIDLRLAQVRYAADGSPRLLVMESLVDGTPSLLETRFGNGVATSTGIDGGVDIERSDLVSLRPVVLSVGFFGAYEALTRRLTSAEVGTEFRAYVAPQAEVVIRVTGIDTETVQTPSATLELRRYDIIIVDPAGEVAMSLSAEPTGELARILVPDQALEVIRNDLASPLTRTVVFSNPGDERATIPADGFGLVATLTRPSAGKGRRPSVVLLSGVSDRDGTVDGVPTLTYLAGALADAGFISVRYDRRGTGQSGGRAESATLENYAEDIRSAFEWLEDRDDVDRDRIGIVGVGDGAWMALQAASDERDFAAVVSIGAPSTTGAEFVLQQQERLFDQAGLSEDERQTRRALQLQIHEAVLTGDGWDELSDDIREQTDTPWFQSYLDFDPADAIEDIRSSLLFVAGDGDELVPPAHAERLGAIARQENEVDTIDVVAIAGMNGELMVEGAAPATAISQELMTTVTAWLSDTLGP
jgi:pimeloyl-ACP methyl ester carboxylesterase